MDGDNANNKLNNLEWATHQVNVQDRVGNTNTNGERSSFAKLSEAQARAICRADGLAAEVAARYGVTTGLVWAIKAGKVWKNLDEKRVPCRPTIQRGERHGGSKLAEADVREIRTSKESGAALARRFGVGASTISMIRHRKLWGHVA